jgi:hypothetical protein
MGRGGRGGKKPDEGTGEEEAQAEEDGAKPQQQQKQQQKPKGQQKQQQKQQQQGEKDGAAEAKVRSCVYGGQRSNRAAAAGSLRGKGQTRPRRGQRSAAATGPSNQPASSHATPQHHDQ